MRLSLTDAADRDLLTYLERLRPGAPVQTTEQSCEVDADLLRLARRELDTETQALLATISNVQADMIESLLTRRGPSFFATEGILSRIHWVIAASASGTSRHETDLLRVIKNLELIATCTVALSSPTGDDVESFADYANHQAYLYRTNPMTVRYSWVAREICREMARQVQQVDPCPGRLACLTPEGIDEVFEVLTEQLKSGQINQTLPLSPSAQALVRQLSITSDHAFAGRLPSELMSTPEATTHPFMVLPNGDILAIHLAEAALRLDQAVIALIDRELLSAAGEGLTKGEVFERTAQACLARALPCTRSFARPARVRLSKDDPGDVDVLLGNQGVLIVGEVKAEASNLSTATAAAFGDQLGKVVRQLTKRLKALAAGATIYDARNREVRQPRRVVGLGITLHDYAGCVVNTAGLEILDIGLQGILVTDLASLILICRALRGPRELLDFIKYRDKLSRLVVMPEDHDVLIGYLADLEGHGPIAHAKTRPEGAKLITLGTHISAHDAWKLDYDLHEWRRTVVQNAVVNVSTPLKGAPAAASPQPSIRLGTKRQ